MKARNLLMGLAVMFLSGCAVNATAPSTYVVNTLPCVSKHPRHKVTIFIAVPTASSIYASTDMAYTQRPYQVAYFVKNSWAATPSQMLQPLMVQTLQNTGHFASVSSLFGSGQFDYLLDTQILQFEQDYTSGHNVFHLRVRAQLIRSATNQLIASKDFSIDLQAPQDTPYGGVYAANAATRDMLAELATFTLRHTR
jgi:cholesterol transport system auxiliary component